MDNGEGRGKEGVHSWKDDKRQITGVFTVTLDSQFLPPQLIYQGTTAACLSRTKFPADWHITCSPNHWVNEVTTKEYILKGSLILTLGKDDKTSNSKMIIMHFVATLKVS